MFYSSEIRTQTSPDKLVGTVVGSVDLSIPDNYYWYFSEQIISLVCCHTSNDNDTFAKTAAAIAGCFEHELH